MNHTLKSSTPKKSVLSWGAMPLLLAFTLTACSSLPPPVEQMAVTKVAVDRASASPNAVEAAPVELQKAREKLDRAQRAMTEKDYVLARRMAEQAEVDARVAESRASSARGERALKEVQESSRALQEEINRRAPR